MKTSTNAITPLITQQTSAKKPFYSLEFFPPKNRENWDNFFAVVEELKQINPLFASVTYGAGGTTSKNTLDITARLAQIGLPPMAHLTCVGATPESLYEYITALDKAHVHSVLALRGDQPKDCLEYDWSAGDFSHASDLVAFVKKNFPHFSVGVAAYPHPHPESKTFAADRKIAAQKMHDSDFAITQVFFDSREYVDYIDALRKHGITKPVIPGILPIQSLESIRRILFLSGGNIPASLYLTLEEANAKGGDAAVREAGINFAVKQIRQLIDCGAPGVHLYTLNKASLCLRIIEEVGL